MQQCGSDDSGDLDHSDAFEVKNGASTKTDCASGTVCCEPKPPTKPGTIFENEPVVGEVKNKCEEISGHSCMTEEVRSFGTDLKRAYLLHLYF